MAKSVASPARVSLSHDIFLAPGPDTVLTQTATPIADSLLAGAAATHAQFQALPLSDSASIQTSSMRPKYQALFGDTFLRSDALFGGTAFDSFFFPETVIRDAEVLAASAFGARDALFVTTGTSVSNQIALLALVKRGERVLADRSCHQSVHFALHSLGARVDYIDEIYACEQTGRNWWSLDALVERAWEAQQQDDSYAAFVLNSQSYDGVTYSIPAVVKALLARHVEIRNLLVDEAWGTAGYFHREQRLHTTMQAAVLLEGSGANVVATHSVHKSASCLRQGSLILVHGDAALVERLKNARYRLHTTSPSHPILAAIDLARAQLVLEGEDMTDRADTIATSLAESIDTDPRLSAYRINRTHLPAAVASYVRLDRTKVSIDLGKLPYGPGDFKQRLHDDFGIWVRRSTANAILLNVHVGIDTARRDRIVEALVALQAQAGAAKPVSPTAFDSLEAPISDRFVIPYPPGIPLVMPGDRLTPELQQRIAAIRQSGTHVFSIS